MSTRDSFSADELFKWVEVQAAMGARRPGSPAGRANEDFIFDKLKAFGLSDVRREPVPVTHWDPTETSLMVENVPISAFAIPYTALTPTNGIEAPLAYASPDSLRGSPDWKGRIVVTEIGFPALDASMLLRLSLGNYDAKGDLKDMSHPATWIRLGWHLYGLAAKAGAVGFVGILKDQPGGGNRMYAPYGFREKDILNKPLPGLWASREDSPALIRQARAGAMARLTLTGTHAPAPSHNIVGEIPGKSDEVLVLSTHHDSPFVSPVEDGSGVAVVLALARHLAKAGPLQRRIVVVFTSGHFYGSIGTRSFIARHRDGIVGRTALEISIEHIALEAVEDAQGKLTPTGRPEPTGFFVPMNRALRDTLLESLTSHQLDRSLILPAEGPLGDYPPTDGGDWYQAGVPVINCISNPVYLLTDDDALRWVDKERLPAVAGLFADLIERLDGVSRKDLSRVDFPVRLALMKMLKVTLRAKTTCFGLKPLH